MIAHINAGIPITRDVTLSRAQPIVTTVAKMMLSAGRKRRSTFWTCVNCTDNQTTKMYHVSVYRLCTDSSEIQNTINCS